MSEHKPVIADTNILFSALLKHSSKFTEELSKPDHDFFICESVLVELFRWKEKIVRLSRLSEEEIIKFYYILLKRVTVFKEELIAEENRITAYELCKDIDDSDTPHVALTLELNGLLWTGDKKLIRKLKEKGFYDFFISK